MQFFDVHAHIDVAKFGAPEERKNALIRAQSANISNILIPGVDPRTWQNLLDISSEMRLFSKKVRFHTAIGIHPWLASELNPEDDPHIFASLRDLLCRSPYPSVAIGECGLDYRTNKLRQARARQLAIFSQHLQLARQLGFPLIIHCVHAYGDLLKLLSEQPLPASIIHSFSGSQEVMELLCKAGHYISFSGSITLPSIRRGLKAVCSVPETRLLIETDCPDQTPFSRRPARNEPAFLIDVATQVAHLRKTTLATIADTTTANAYRVLGLSA